MWISKENYKRHQSYERILIVQVHVPENKMFNAGGRNELKLIRVKLNRMCRVKIK